MSYNGIQIISKNLVALRAGKITINALLDRFEKANYDRLMTTETAAAWLGMSKRKFYDMKPGPAPVMWGRYSCRAVSGWAHSKATRPTAVNRRSALQVLLEGWISTAAVSPEDTAAELLDVLLDRPLSTAETVGRLEDTPHWTVRRYVTHYKLGGGIRFPLAHVVQYPTYRHPSAR